MRQMRRDRTKVPLWLLSVLMSTALLFALSLSACEPRIDRRTVQSERNDNATPRLVSLAPSNTELLYQLSADETVSGVCSNCPKVLTGWSGLDKKPIVGSFVSVNLERLTQLKPSTVLLVNGQEPLQAMLKKRGFNVVLLSNNKLSDIPANLSRLGKASQKEEGATHLLNRFNQQLSELKAVMNVKPVRVFYCVWPQPLLTIGNTSFLNDVITACGGTNIAGNLAQPYPQFTVEKLVVADPDVVVLPFEMKDKPVLKKFPWTSLRAVRSGRLYFLPDPDHDHLARPTLRIFSGLSWLAVRLHPELSDKIKAWEERWLDNKR